LKGFSSREFGCGKMAEGIDKKKGKVEMWREMEEGKRERTVSERLVMDKWLKRKRESGEKYGERGKEEEEKRRKMWRGMWKRGGMWREEEVWLCGKK